VGVKYPIKPGFKYVFTNKDQTFPIVLLDENGNPVNGEGISLKLYRLNWHWWWDSDEDEEEGYYSESRSTAPYWEKKDISVKDGRALVTINMPDRDWGRYLLVVKDGKKGHEAGGEIFFDWENWYSRAQNDGSKAAAVLSFTLDKETYNVGDKVKVTIPTPEKGRVLITVENRSRVLSSKWVDAQAGTTVVDVDVTVAAEAPKLMPHRLAMRENLSSAMGVGVDSVGLKATTTEGLGFVGRREGIACWAVCLLEEVGPKS
jgi:uncharacterized protein YfaS (alpha-2-macroglobulin family)